MSTKMEMAGHFRKAVAEIDGDIVKLRQDLERLQGMRNGIVELYGGETEIPPVGMMDAPAPKKRKAARGGASASAGSVVKVEPKRGMLAATLEAELRKGTAVSADRLVEISGAGIGSVRSQVYRWKAKGLVKQDDSGNWVGTFLPVV